jgi:glucose/arabinose dehydrogenase
VEESFDDSPDETTYDLQSTPLLDISDDVINENERGLLGMAFSTDGRKLYLDYTRQPDGATVVVEYELGDRTTIDEDSRRELLVVEQPFANHNGGQLVVGPDGFLYIGLGDGGDRGDPFGNGQNTDALLGSILRIDPEGAAEDGPAFAVPPGNPFADGEDGDPTVWLYGVRNPWRFTFDTATGDLWVADVGQNAYEEINRLPAVGGFDAGKGANLGWAEMEATHPYDGGQNPPGAVLPIFEYSHDTGCSITGGYVYRGERIPTLQGVYLFSDFCAAGIRGLQLDQGTVIDDRTWDLPVEQVQSFGQDDDGEVYLLLASGPVLKLTAL